MKAAFEPGVGQHVIDVAFDVTGELASAVARYPAMNSPHEGYAVILEELDELWDEVKKKPSARSNVAMRDEAIQVAAMAIRFVIDICDKGD